MSVASRRPRGHASRAVEEALGAVAAPVVRDGILGSALSRAGLVAVPDDGETLQGFIRGDLRRAVSERLGPDVAEGVVSELWPLIAMLGPGRPRSAPTPTSAVSVPAWIKSPPPTSRPGNAASSDDDDASGVVVVGSRGKTVRAGDSLSVLVVVSRDGQRARELAIALTGKAVVRPVLDLVDMGEAIEDHRGEQPVVLFDCTQPPFHLESVATFASELPCGSWLALLDASAEHEKTARSFAGSTLTIARLTSVVGTDEIARRCLALFD